MAVVYLYKDSDPVTFRYLSPSRSSGQIPPPYASDMTPSVYIEFATEDLTGGTKRGLVNAFGNAKRALHLAIDTLLQQYGLFWYFRKSNFPAKLGVLDEIGILPVTIIRNLNVERNMLEHEYSTPTRKRVEEAVDVARLLILATEKLLEATPIEVVAGWKKPRRHSLIQLHPHNGQLRVYTITAPGQYHKVQGVSCLFGIRSFDGVSLTKGVRVAKKAWRVIHLKKAEKATWVPIISELVGIQQKEHSRRTSTIHDTTEVTIPVTVPATLPEGYTWHELIDKAMKKQYKDAKE